MQGCSRMRKSISKIRKLGTAVRLSVIDSRGMTDKDIVDALIARDEAVTDDFFWVKCRPLFCSIIYKVFHHKIDENADVREDDYYKELVDMFYMFLMSPGKQSKDDAHTLKSFGFRCSLYQWIKVVALRFMLKKKDEVIENVSSESPYIKEGEEPAVSTAAAKAREEVEEIFSLMLSGKDGKPKKGIARKAAETRILIIRRLLLEEEKPEKLAAEMGKTVANIYNMKKRALADFRDAALQERKEK